MARWLAVCLGTAAMVARDDRLLNDLVLRCVPRLVDLAEERCGFLASHVVRYLDRFGHWGDPTTGWPHSTPWILSDQNCCGRTKPEIPIANAQRDRTGREDHMTIRLVPVVLLATQGCFYVKPVQERDPLEFEIYECPDQSCTLTVWLSTDTTYCPTPASDLQNCLNQNISPCPVQISPVQFEGRDCCLDGCLNGDGPCEEVTIVEGECCDSSEEANFGLGDVEALEDATAIGIGTTWDEACVDGWVEVVDSEWSCAPLANPAWSNDECTDPNQARYWNGGTALSLSATKSWFDLQNNLGPAGHRFVSGSLSLDDDVTPVIHGYLRSKNFVAQGKSFDYAELHMLADGTVNSAGTALQVDGTDVASVEVELAKSGSSVEHVRGVTVPGSAGFQFLIRPEGAPPVQRPGMTGSLTMRTATGGLTWSWVRHRTQS